MRLLPHRVRHSNQFSHINMKENKVCLLVHRVHQSNQLSHINKMDNRGVLLPQGVHRLNEFSNINTRTLRVNFTRHRGVGGGGEKLKTPYHILSDGSTESSETG